MEPTNFRTPARWNSVQVPERVAARAIANANVQDDGCWISRYSVASHGYAQVGWNEPGEKTQMVLAHRAAWVSAHGQVPLGMTIDHTCKVRPCVNPAHLRLLPNAENARRNQGDDFPLGQCRNGHPDTSRGPITRRTKSGESRVGETCKECMQAGRDKWVAENPDKRRTAVAKHSAKRKAERHAAKTKAATNE